ncbi:aldehyde dehydrogenase B (plasmid) [Sinorhizobium americanum CCGM7]|nr:aldehyde dehydrogenase B [Sinorhizobium americanum CCGM7]
MTLHQNLIAGEWVGSDGVANETLPLFAAARGRHAQGLFPGSRAA